MSEVREGALHSRVLPDGATELVAYPMTFGKARLCVGPAGASGYDDAWCYERPDDAIVACTLWDAKGDPPGRWHRHIGSGRRREYDAVGNIIREWVAR